MKLRLIPVVVFGSCGHHDIDCDEWGYGFMDATWVGSDCNRARGHVFRVQPAADIHYEEDLLGPTSIVVDVPDSDLWFFEKNWDAE